jgi:hypothetical protein
VAVEAASGPRRSFIQAMTRVNGSTSDDIRTFGRSSPAPGAPAPPAAARHHHHLRNYQAGTFFLCPDNDRLTPYKAVIARGGRARIEKLAPDTGECMGD